MILNSRSFQFLIIFNLFVFSVLPLFSMVSSKIKSRSEILSDSIANASPGLGQLLRDYNYTQIGIEAMQEHTKHAKEIKEVAAMDVAISEAIKENSGNEKISNKKMKSIYLCGVIASTGMGMLALKNNNTNIFYALTLGNVVSAYKHVIHSREATESRFDYIQDELNCVKAQFKKIAADHNYILLKAFLINKKNQIMKVTAS